jgi:sulfate/thiosulfate-binding protein
MFRRSHSTGQASQGGTKILLSLAMAIGIGASALGLAACGGSGSDSASGKIDLVAYSTPQQAYEDGIIPAFQATEAGTGVEFSTSFGSSGDQRRAVEAGQPADYVGFSLEPDMSSVVEAGIVAPTWNQNEYKGIVTESVVVMMVRPGNPKGVEDWDDLTRADVEVIQPNPATSGGAKWNIMAQYGSQVNAGKSEQEALQFVADVFANTTVLDDSARDSLQTFSTGKGDVLIGYENEGIQAKEEGIELEIVYPKSESTLLIENPAAVTEKAQNPDAAKAFLDFIWSDEGQTKFADYGYRPVNDSVAAEYADTFPSPAELFTIADLGGWEKVDSEFFDDTNGKVTAILRKQGAPLE